MSANRATDAHRGAHPVHHGGFLITEALLIVAILALGLVVKNHPQPLPGDVEIELAVQHLLLPHVALAQLIEIPSTINWPNPAGGTVIVVIVTLLLLRRWLDALVAFFVTAMGDLSSFLANQVVQRPRPTGHGITVLKQITTYFSFPSGHVVHVFGFFGLLIFLSYQTDRYPALLRVLRGLLFLLMVLIAPSRIMEGEHWPSDVLEGMLFGLFWLLLGIHLYHWASHRWPSLLAADERQGQETPLMRPPRERRAVP